MSAKQVTPSQAFAILSENKKSVLIDVRTKEEFSFVGIANATNFDNRMILLPLRFLPNMEENPDFAVTLSESLEKMFSGQEPSNITLLFICRSGARSNEAANYFINLGYKNSYNIISGFEGDLNEENHRGKLNGWKAENLPWRQS